MRRVLHEGHTPQPLQEKATTTLTTAAPESVWTEHRESTRGRDLDITGISYAMLDAQGQQQWPLLEGQTTGKKRLYEDSIFPTTDGKAKFVNTEYKPVAEPSIEMNAQDMERRRLRDGDLVHVSSKRGFIVVPVLASAALAPQQTFFAMHWGEEFLSGASSTGERLAGVNALTTPAYCPTSKQPKFKHAAVIVLKAELPWSLLGIAWLPDDVALQARKELKALMAKFAFASCTPFGRERSGLLFRAAYDTPDDALLASIEALLGMGGTEVLRYADKKRSQRRAVQLMPAVGGCHAKGETRLNAILLAGDTSAQSWLKTLL